MLTSLTWVRRGAAARAAARFEPSGDQLALLREMRESVGVEAAALRTSELQAEGIAAASSAAADVADGDREFDEKFGLDNYDEEDDADGDLDSAPKLRENEALNSMFGGSLLEQIETMARDLQEETGAAEVDPETLLDDSEDDEDDMADLFIRETDAVLVGAHSEEDVSHLDVYVYEPEKDNLYVHHDLLLPTFPLAVEWLDYRPDTGLFQTEKARIEHERALAQGAQAETHGNLVAVASYLPGVEIWDLDVLDVLEPVLVLGGEMSPEEAAQQMQQQQRSEKVGKQKKSKRRQRQQQQAAPASTLRADSHAGAVMCLSWNRIHRNILASGGSDHTVKVWDLATGQCAYTLRNHTKEVQAVRWHPTAGTVLASGSFDCTVCIVDGAIPDAAPLRLTVSADIEDLRWDPVRTSQILVSCEDGHVYCFETGIGTEEGAANAQDTPLWTLAAHAKSTSAVAMHPLVPGLMATVGIDKMLKLWNTSTGVVVPLFSKNIGKPLFDVAWTVESDLSADLANPRTWTLACGGRADGDKNSTERLFVANICELSHEVANFVSLTIAAAQEESSAQQ